MDVLEATPGAKREFNAAEIGAIAHLYRGEVYRSTVWRTRLDNTTNWAVAGLGIAMSISFSHTEASALPILLIGGLMVVFLFFEARRYRYFNVWRARCRWLETNWYSPMLLGKGCPCGTGWEKVLSQDYREPQYHISFSQAIGRRLRRTYFCVLTIQALAAHWIRTYLVTRGDDLKPLFINSRSRNPEQKRLTPRAIQLMIAKYARLAGLSKKVTPHTLRHTYATDLLSRGADLRSVQELLGHKNVSTTQVYTHVTNKRLRDIHERFHGGQNVAQ